MQRMTAITIGIVLWLTVTQFGASAFDYPNDADFENTDEDTLARLRIERSDYSIGGPLAKGTQPPNTGNGGQGFLPSLLTGDRQIFKQYLKQRNRTYANSSDEDQHFQQFQASVRRIKELNSARRPNSDDAEFGQTKFADRSFSDFAKKHTGSATEPRPAEKFNLDITKFGRVPPAFDWRDQGVVPPIRNQKECGACYAFSTTDLAAIQWAIDHQEKRSYVLSPQYILDCIHGDAAKGCDGGRPFYVLDTNANCSTTTSASECYWPQETCYPYQNAASGKCKQTSLQCAQSAGPQIRIRQAHYLDVSGSALEEKARLSSLLQSGPVIALVTVTDHWQHYTRGIMRTRQCAGGGTPNHAVLIVGYNFTDPDNDYYVVRNTWDTDWGEKGYFRIDAGANTCHIAEYLSFACTNDCGNGGSKSKDLLERARKRLSERGGGGTAGGAGSSAGVQAIRNRVISATPPQNGKPASALAQAIANRHRENGK